MEITLKKENVVKIVNSEQEAAILINKGFKKVGKVEVEKKEPMVPEEKKPEPTDAENASETEGKKPAPRGRKGKTQTESIEHSEEVKADPASQPSDEEANAESADENDSNVKHN